MDQTQTGATFFGRLGFSFIRNDGEHAQRFDQRIDQFGLSTVGGKAEGIGHDSKTRNEVRARANDYCCTSRTLEKWCGLMPLADIASIQKKPDDVVCREWKGSAPKSRRCEFFVSNGGCAREEEFMCLEWMRAQGMKHQFEFGNYTESEVQIAELHATARKLQESKAKNAPPKPVGPAPQMPGPSKLELALAKLKETKATKQKPSSGLEAALVALRTNK